MRVVLDTNIFISALLTPQSVAATVLEQWRARRYELLTSTMILAELRRVLGYPKFARLREQRPEAILDLLQLLWRHTEIVDDYEMVAPLASDPSDTMVLSLAKAAGAHAIVSGDAHLLGLGSYESIPILTPRAFLDLLARS